MEVIELDLSSQIPLKSKLISASRQRFKVDLDEPEPPKSYNLKIIRKIGERKFKIFLAFCVNHQTNLVIKGFSNQIHNDRTKYFQNEIRFCNLQHPNVIEMISSVPNSTLLHNTEKIPMSYIIMEHAMYGDLGKIYKIQRANQDEKLVRTYFHQLISGLEYLHENNIAHLDIKTANLLLGKGYQLKIADFDLSYKKGDLKFRSKGTSNYRSLELKLGQCVDPFASDIFSAGVVLFALKTGGILPYDEDDCYENSNMYYTLTNDPQKFWAIHRRSHIKNTQETFGKAFRELFSKMVEADPKKRASIQDIKESEWYLGGTVYTQDELESLMQGDYKLENSL